jgi:hypothetical protein
MRKGRPCRHWKPTPRRIGIPSRRISSVLSVPPSAPILSACKNFLCICNRNKLTAKPPGTPRRFFTPKTNSFSHREHGGHRELFWILEFGFWICFEFRILDFFLCATIRSVLLCLQRFLVHPQRKELNRQDAKNAKAEAEKKNKNPCLRASANSHEKAQKAQKILLCLLCLFAAIFIISGCHPTT